MKNFHFSLFKLFYELSKTSIKIYWKTVRKKNINWLIEKYIVFGNTIQFRLFYKIKKVNWNFVSSFCSDVDPTLRNESTDDEGIQLADEMLEALDLTREVPLRNKFPKRRGGSNDS